MVKVMSRTDRSTVVAESESLMSWCLMESKKDAAPGGHCGRKGNQEHCDQEQPGDTLL